MDKKILLDNQYAESSYIEEYKLAHLRWKTKNIPSDIYKEAFTVLLDYSEIHGVVNFIADGRLSGAVSPANRKWFQNVAMSRADEVGLKRGAIVIKAEPFRKYYINQITKWASRKNNYVLKVFTDYEKAIQWLISFEDYK